jgi:hypothetical protein
LTQQLFRIFKYVFYFIACLIAIVVVVFIGSNLRDDLLRPEVKQALDWQVPPNAFNKENGYVFLHGFYAPLDQDPYVVGKAILEGELKRYAISKTARTDPPPNEYKYWNPFVDWKDERCDYSGEKSCVAFYSSIDKNGLKALETSLAPFKVRFDEFKKRQLFIEAHPPLITALSPPPMSLFRKARSLRGCKLPAILRTAKTKRA